MLQPAALAEAEGAVLEQGMAQRGCPGDSAVREEKSPESSPQAALTLGEDKTRQESP